MTVYVCFVTEMDNGVVVPHSPKASQRARSVRSKRQNSCVHDIPRTAFGGPKTPSNMMNGDVHKPVAISIPTRQDTTMDIPIDVRTLKSEKSFRIVTSKKTSARSIRAPGFNHPKATTGRVITRPQTVTKPKTPALNSERAVAIPKVSLPRKPPVPKFVRRFTSTKIGSMSAKRAAPPPPVISKQLGRSQTIALGQNMDTGKTC